MMPLLDGPRCLEELVLMQFGINAEHNSDYIGYHATVINHYILTYRSFAISSILIRSRQSSIQDLPRCGRQGIVGVPLGES